MPPDVLAYRYNNGGLSNQKLAMLGLMLAGRDRALPVRLPRLYNLDQSCEAARASSPIERSYELDPLLDFARRRGIEILPEDPAAEGEGWEFFHAAGQYVAARFSDRALDPDDIACDFFRSLRPLVRRDPSRAPLWEDPAAAALVVQMRIERDWEWFSRITLRPVIGTGEDYAPSFSDIMAKVANTLGDRHRSAFVVCDERALPVPIEQIRRIAREVFGFELTWKSDLLDPVRLAAASALENSIADFEVAVTAGCFVGLTRSSFSNLVSLERYSRDRRQVDAHYIYNLSGPYVVRRIDNGAYAFPRRAAGVA